MRMFPRTKIEPKRAASVVRRSGGSLRATDATSYADRAWRVDGSRPLTCLPRRPGDAASSSRSLSFGFPGYLVRAATCLPGLAAGSWLRAFTELAVAPTGANRPCPQLSPQQETRVRRRFNRRSEPWFRIFGRRCAGGPHLLAARSGGGWLLQPGDQFRSGSDGTCRRRFNGAWRAAQAHHRPVVVRLPSLQPSFFGIAFVSNPERHG